MAMVADTQDHRPERCHFPGCGAFTRTGLLCPEHQEIAQQFETELTGVATPERIPLAELSVDRRFQRPPVEHHISKIALNFNERYLGRLLVSRRSDERVAAGEDRYAILDGQQRWNALLRMRFAWAPCDVLTGLSLEQEILTFCVHNRERKWVRQSLLFIDQAKAGVEPYRTAWAILKQFRYEVTDLGPRGKVTINQLACPATVEKVHRMGRLSPTLFCMRQAWPDDNAPNHPEVVLGIAAFLQLNQHIPADELASALGRFDCEALREQARQVNKGSTDRRLWVHFYEQVVQAFNYQKQARNRVPRMDVSINAPRIWFP